MTPELTALTLAALLQIAQFIAVAIPANLELGPGYTASPRDTDRRDRLSPRTARLLRAFDNHFEGLILFTIAVVVVTFGGAANGITAACAWVYVAARIAYVPAYALGLAPWRSLIWFIGFGATALMLLVALGAALV